MGYGGFSVTLDGPGESDAREEIDRGMKPAVIGARVHSGWAAVLAISGERDSPDVIDRRRILIVDSTVVGASQPYHFAENLDLPDAEKYLANCAAASEILASAAIREMVEELRVRGFQGCRLRHCVGRWPAPAFPAGHPGFARSDSHRRRRVLSPNLPPVLRNPKYCGDRHSGARSRRSGQGAVRQGGNPSPGKNRQPGAVPGPTWTQDQKAAALAASIVFADLCGHTHRKAPSPSVD